MTKYEMKDRTKACSNWVMFCVNLEKARIDPEGILRPFPFRHHEEAVTPMTGQVRPKPLLDQPSHSHDIEVGKVTWRRLRCGV